MSVDKRERIEWLNYWIEDANTDKKRIILLGDSVTRELRKKLNSFMADKYAVDVIAMSYSILDDMAMEEIRHYFTKTTYQYASILYQMGAHHGYHIECAKSCSDAKRFENRTNEILTFLSKYSHHVMTVSATFEREVDPNGKNILHHNREIAERNEILKRVSEKLDIPYLDLNKEIDYHEIRHSDWCHFYEECYEHIAEVILKHSFKEIKCISSNRIGTFEELDKKLNSYRNKKIYIFGNGVRGKRLKMYLERRGYSFDGFIVSEQYVESSKDVFLLHELNQADTLIIVTPVDAAIWNELHRRRFDYISLNSELYISMDG